jgi:hypothetical protein
MCDRDEKGAAAQMPITLQAWNRVLLPGPRGTATPHDWVDPNPQATIDVLVKKITAEIKQVRLLDCNHPLASINATIKNNESPESLLYTSASQAAQNLFGTAEMKNGPKRLVGRNMTEFLREVKRRMHPVQWKMFRRDQQAVRTRLSNGELTAIARIPIVFEPVDDGDRRRAYIPLIVHGFQPDGGGESWFNLRVLYLDVTTVTVVEEAPNGDQYYACDLNHSEGKLEALKPFPSVKAFISYTREEASKEAEQLAERLKKLAPYVDYFVDVTSIGIGKAANAELIKAMDEADIFFVLVSSKPRGNGQSVEIDYLNGRIFQNTAPVIVPVLLDDCQPQPRLDRFEWVKWGDLDPKKLKSILLESFRNRSDDDWVEEVAEMVKVCNASP